MNGGREEAVADAVEHNRQSIEIAFNRLQPYLALVCAHHSHQAFSMSHEDTFDESTRTSQLVRPHPRRARSAIALDVDAQAGDVVEPEGGHVERVACMTV